jgi:hypothetical protein
MEKTRQEFINTIQLLYKEFCKEKGTEETVEGFASFLVNKSLILDKTINRFLIVEKYPATLKKNLGIKQIAIWDLEEVVPLKETSIRAIIKDFAVEFVHRNRLNS